MEKNGGRLMLKSRVEEILVTNGRASGIKLRGGAVINASAAVISNATVWDTLPMLPEAAKAGEHCGEDEAKREATREWVREVRGYRDVRVVHAPAPGHRRERFAGRPRDSPHIRRGLVQRG